MPKKCPCRTTNPLAQTVYPLQDGKVHPNFENKKKFPEKNFLASTTTTKIRWFHWWNPFLNPLTINGDICNFLTAVSGLCNRLQRSVYHYARRPILRTGQHLPCAAFSSCTLHIASCVCIVFLCFAVLITTGGQLWWANTFFWQLPWLLVMCSLSVICLEK